MMNRRSLLKLFGGGALASRVVSVGEVANAMSATPSGAVNAIGSAGPVDCCTQREVMSRAKDAVLRQMQQRRRTESDLLTAGLPTKVATKKSWSPAFKMHLAVKDEMEIAAMRRADVDWVSIVEQMMTDTIGVPNKSNS